MLLEMVRNAILDVLRLLFIRKKKEGCQSKKAESVGEGCLDVKLIRGVIVNCYNGYAGHERRQRSVHVISFRKDLNFGIFGAGHYEIAIGRRCQKSSFF